MESLYVCLFSNGHIKVGRSIDPQARIASHVDRVSCVGVELAAHITVECAGASEPREASLIGRCAEAATRRFKNEWFDGLDFAVVSEWAREAAALSDEDMRLPDAEPPTAWAGIVKSVQRRTGLNQCQLAQECGCSQPSISDLVTGRTREPSYSIGKRLMDLLEAYPGLPTTDKKAA
jgi:hypothetical protein